MRWTGPLQSFLMIRRDFVQSLGAGALSSFALHAAIPKSKITRVRYYHVEGSRPIFNQTSHIVTVETDQGLMGVGEGATRTRSSNLPA